MKQENDSIPHLGGTTKAGIGLVQRWDVLLDCNFSDLDSSPGIGMWKDNGQ